MLKASLRILGRMRLLGELDLLSSNSASPKSAKTNKNLNKIMDLQEFYVWLGCIFFMSCFQVIKDRDLWWSSKAIDMYFGTLFASTSSS